MTAAAPLSAWWWRKADNFGDVLTPFVLAYVSGRAVAWQNLRRAEFFAIGSILHILRNRIREGGPGAHVWGSGMLEPIPGDFLDTVEVSLTRGPLTAGQIGAEAAPYGDPGLLAGRVFDLRARAAHPVGVIAHLSHTGHAGVRALAERFGGVVIPMETRDVEGTVRAIAGCERILSSSLHGLVVADALGIPNTWIDTGRVGNRTAFKYYDYALGVGRVLDRPAGVETLLDGGLPEPDTGYLGGLEAVKDRMENAFPRAERALETGTGRVHPC